MTRVGLLFFFLFFLFFLVDDHVQPFQFCSVLCSFSTAASVGRGRRGTVEVDLRGRVGLGLLCFLGPDIVAGDRLKELLDVVVGLGGGLEERRLVGGDELVDLFTAHSSLSDDRTVLLEQVICRGLFCNTKKRRKRMREMVTI